MPRKGPAPKRPRRQRSRLRFRTVSPSWSTSVLLDGKKSVARAHRLRCSRGRRAEDRTRTRSDVLKQRSGQHQALPLRFAPAALAAPPTRCRSRFAPAAPTTLALRWLVDFSRAAPREHHDRASDQRDPGRRQRSRRRCQAPRGHSQDGRVQQGLRPLPLVIAVDEPAQRFEPAALRSTH